MVGCSSRVRAGISVGLHHRCSSSSASTNENVGVYGSQSPKTTVSVAGRGAASRSILNPIVMYTCAGLYVSHNSCRSILPTVLETGLLLLAAKLGTAGLGVEVVVPGRLVSLQAPRGGVGVGVVVDVTVGSSSLVVVGAAIG